MTRSFWRGRRVLITGHTGFKGSWLALWLDRLGAEVVGYARGGTARPAAFGLDTTSFDGDIRDLAKLEAALAAARPEVVFHMAAQPIVRESFKTPLDTYEINVMGTVTVLEAVRRSPQTRVVVNVTSDQCYDDRREWTLPYRESEPLGGRDPYSSSKACSEIVTAAYRSSFFEEAGAPALASARSGNVIGGGDFGTARLVPDAMRAAADGGVLVLRNPHAIRPWQHVLNPLSGYMLLAERMWDDRSLAGAWNFGPDEADVCSVASVADRLRALWPERLVWRAEAADAGVSAPRDLGVDSSKARELLGWAPAWDLDEGLARTVAWHRALIEGDDMRAVTIGQIDAFADLLAPV